MQAHLLEKSERQRRPRGARSRRRSNDEHTAAALPATAGAAATPAVKCGTLDSAATTSTIPSLRHDLCEPDENQPQPWFPSTTGLSICEPTSNMYTQSAGPPSALIVLFVIATSDIVKLVFFLSAINMT